MRWVGLVIVFGCYRGAPAPGEAPPSRSDSGQGPANRVFVSAEVRAIHKCTPDAPPTVVILLSEGPATSWMQIDLAHGERDRAPRRFAIGSGAGVMGCRRACGERPTGTFTLDVLEPGRRARGRYRFVFADGAVVEDRYDAKWSGTPWGVEPCPTVF